MKYQTRLSSYKSKEITLRFLALLKLATAVKGDPDKEL